MLRKILIAFGLLILAPIVAGVCVFHRIDSQLAQLAQDSTEKLKKLEPHVIRGAGQFKKSTFYEGGNLGEATEILVGWPAGLEGAALAVVGTRGAHFLDNGGLLKKQVRFSKAFTLSPFSGVLPHAF